MEVEIHLSEFDSNKPLWKYAVGIKQEVRGYRLPFLTYEKVWQGEKLILNRPDNQDKKDKERLTQTHLEQINANKEFREITRFLESTVYLHLLPQLLKHPQSFTVPDLPGDPFGKGFLDRISKVNEKTRNAWLKKIETALKIAVPQFNKFDFKEENGRPHLEAIYDHWRPGAGKQKEDQFLDGTLRLIGNDHANKLAQIPRTLISAVWNTATSLGLSKPVPTRRDGCFVGAGFRQAHQ